MINVGSHSFVSSGGWIHMVISVLLWRWGVWRQAVNRIAVQLGASPLGGFELLGEVVFRWSDSRKSMQYCLISLHLVGTRLVEHAPVYMVMGLYDGNTALTWLGGEWSQSWATDNIIINVVIRMRGVFGDVCEMVSFLYLSENFCWLSVESVRLFYWGVRTRFSLFIMVERWGSGGGNKIWRISFNCPYYPFLSRAFRSTLIKQSDLQLNQDHFWWLKVQVQPVSYIISLSLL